MGLFSNDKMGPRDNSGTAGKGFTVTGRAKVQAKAIRKEWTGPRKAGGNKRPGQ